MQVRPVFSDKRRFLDLLLLADEQENMIDRYLDRGELFALYDDDLKAVCVVTNEGDGIFELKNIATVPEEQGKGYGRALIGFLMEHYGGKGRMMLVGTGEVPSALTFYQKCGFVLSHRLRNFFTDHYDHPIFEDGIRLVDMIYLKRSLNGCEMTEQ